MKIAIEGFDLPGRTFCDAEGAVLDDVRVGLQVRSEPEGLVAGDADSARWELDVEVGADPDFGLDFRGPAVHGKRGERFLYLTWGNVTADGFSMFMRAKLMLHRIDPDLVRAADAGVGLSAAVRLSDDRGLPRCARVDPPDIRWTRLALT